MVLSTCSPYFRSLFATVPPHLHPVVFLKDVDVRIVELLLRYMYSGQISVHGERLVPLVQAAKSLRIKGLLDVPVPNATAPNPPAAADPSEAAAVKAATNVSHNKSQPLNNRVRPQASPVPVRKQPKMIKLKTGSNQPAYSEAVAVDPLSEVGNCVSLESRFQPDLSPSSGAAGNGPTADDRVVYPVISVDDDTRHVGFVHLHIYFCSYIKFIATTKMWYKFLSNKNS
jgi:hypothetical protein